MASGASRSELLGANLRDDFAVVISSARVMPGLGPGRDAVRCDLSDSARRAVKK